MQCVFMIPQHVNSLIIVSKINDIHTMYHLQYYNNFISLNI